MSFALCISSDTDGDLEILVSRIRDARLNQQDKLKCDPWWNTGLSAWATASRVPATHPYYWDWNTTTLKGMVIVPVTGDTLDGFCRHLAYLAREYPTWAGDCQTFADSFKDRQYAIEPWPWAPVGVDPWADWPVGT